MLLRKYPNIGDYYGYFISRTLEIATKSVRSNYQIYSRAFRCQNENRVRIESVYSYRVYPSTDGFQNIIVGFSEDENGPSQCKHVAINTPDGTQEVISIFDYVEKDDGGDISKIAEVNTSKYASQPHLDVELKITEYSSDHWSLISFKAL